MNVFTRYFLRISSITMFLFALIIQSTWALDLTGEWLLKDSPSKVYIFHVGNNVDAVFSYNDGMPFKTGDRHFYGVISNDAITGSMHIKDIYGRIDRYDNFSMMISKDGNTLLRADNVTYIRGVSTSNRLSVTLDANLNMKIPNATYQPALGNPINLWANFQFVPSSDGSMTWKLSNYGVNP